MAKSAVLRKSRVASSVLAVLLSVQGMVASVDAAPRIVSTQTREEPARGKYTLRITNQGVTEITLNASQASVSEITADLSKRLGVPLFVGPALSKETVSANFLQLQLEPALSALAPRVLIDYEIRQGMQPAPKGIYLLGMNDPEPEINAVIRGAGQGLFIEGNTEDPAQTSADAALQVHGDKNRLTVISKRQPLAVVLSAIGQQLNVPAEVEYDAADLVDADVTDRPAEDVIPALSPKIRVYLRVDVNRFEKTLLRLVVVPVGAR